MPLSQNPFFRLMLVLAIPFWLFLIALFAQFGNIWGGLLFATLVYAVFMAFIAAIIWALSPGL